jgi:hypothetical protein
MALRRVRGEADVTMMSSLRSLIVRSLAERRPSSRRDGLDG